MNELSNILADTNSNFGDDDEPDPLPDIEDVDEPQEEEEYDPLEHVFPPSQQGGEKKGKRRNRNRAEQRKAKRQKLKQCDPQKGNR